MAYNNLYTNSDSLTIRFGVESGRAVRIGSASQAGNKQTIKAVIKWDELEAFGTVTLLDPLRQNAIPNGAIITKADFVTTTAFTGSGATLTLGTYKVDGTTAIDEDGIDATIALTAIDAVGETVTCDGAQVAGTAMTFDAYLVALVGTANYTAGQGTLTVEYIIPSQPA